MEMEKEIKVFYFIPLVGQLEKCMFETNDERKFDLKEQCQMKIVRG